MPELPEVETMRRNIASALTGATVERYDLTLPKLLRTSPIPTLDPIVGKRLIEVRRRAKVLMIDFEGDLTLAMHAKLAGQITIIRPDESRLVAGHPHPSPTGDFPANTTHLTVWFEDGSRFVLQRHQAVWLVSFSANRGYSGARRCNGVRSRGDRWERG